LQVNKRYSLFLALILGAWLGLQVFYPTNIQAQSPGPSPSETPVKLFSSPPTLTARAAFAIDADTGRILFNKEGSKRLPMASTTKIMTALTLFDIPGVNLEDVTIVVKDDLVGEANMGLSEGMRAKIVTLLYGLMMGSANDAGMAIARYAGAKLPGSGDPVKKFTTRMTTLAGKLGLKNSNFTNPHGLDEDLHYSSAEDLAVAGWYALQNKTIANIVRLSEVNFNGSYFFNISNFVRRYPGANGIKPGETDNAGLCIVASASRYRRNAIIVLLNSPAMRTESDLLMDYAFSQIFAGNTIATPSPTAQATAAPTATLPVTATRTTATVSPSASATPPIPANLPNNAYIGLPMGDRLLPFKNEATRTALLDNLEQYMPLLIGDRR
jgi:serine-type D-Ala-D-Ala carboxypeptidase (penicillin-binding protein 5/6)